ncbi:MAG: DUF2461 domain-containing protein [Pseudomonadota bacterium]
MFEAPFLGFAPAAFKWFDGIEANNTKEWFTDNRATFEAEVKEPLNRLLNELAAELGGTTKVFRQNRDIRFSKDKRPYKTNTYGVVSGIGSGTFGLYVSINATRVLCGTGEYDMAKDQLDRFRKAIADPESGDAFVEAYQAVEEAGISIEGEALKTAPRGYPKDHPRIEHLRRKQLLMMNYLPKAQAKGRAPFEHALSTWRAAQPMVAWLSEHVGESEVPPEARFRR